MKLIDISWPISESTTEYKNNDTILFEHIKTFDRDAARDTRISLGAHVGTHVDAPAHFLKDGHMIDCISLAKLVGRARVIPCLDVNSKSISRDDLEMHEINEGDIVLLRTTNSNCEPTDPFNTEFVFLNESGARYLLSKKIKAVGIDYLGIERGNPEHPTHTLFMQADVPIIEGLRLGHVNPGIYFFVCLPLCIMGLEAAPARAVLFEG